ncbi:MAG: response regulator [Victivallales bacterium]|jgi:excisionase family DNA binding protein
MRKLLKTNDAAQYLGVSRSSLTNWVKQNLLGSGLTPGGHYRFTVDELDKFAERRGLRIPKTLNDSGKIKILVIDDDGAFREFIKDALDVFSGFELREASDGMQGVLLIGTWQPDLVILDLRMPNMNGIDFCRILRQNEDTEDVKVIITSAHLSPEAKAEILKLSVDVVLEKPVRLGSIVAAVEKCTDLKLK